jgi:hypothetical protein
MEIDSLKTGQNWQSMISQANVGSRTSPLKVYPVDVMHVGISTMVHLELSEGSLKFEHGMARVGVREKKSLLPCTLCSYTYTR